MGMYEKDAKEKGIEVETLTDPPGGGRPCDSRRRRRGLPPAPCQEGSDRILGATLVAEHAGDMLGELCLAVTHGIGLKKIASVIHPYPTQGEVVKKAADAWSRTRLTPRSKKIFGWWFRLFF